MAITFNPGPRFVSSEFYDPIPLSPPVSVSTEMLESMLPLMSPNVVTTQQTHSAPPLQRLPIFDPVLDTVTIYADNIMSSRITTSTVSSFNQLSMTEIAAREKEFRKFIELKMDLPQDRFRDEVMTVPWGDKDVPITRGILDPYIPSAPPVPGPEQLSLF